MRLFVAVWPSADAVDALRDAVAAMRAGAIAGRVRWTPDDHWHATLRFLGEMPEAEVGDVVARLETGLAGTPAVDAVLGGATVAFGRSVLVAPVTGLESLAAAAVAATAGVGEAPDDRPFAGHVTVARADRRGRASVRPLAGAPLRSVRWRVGEVTLVRSAGGRYDVIGRWPLG